MFNLSEQKQKANSLRKNGNHKEALDIYRLLWKENGDKFDGSGLLQCLRKLSLFDEAIPLADELIVKFKNFEWCRNEVIWTYIQGIFDQLAKDSSLTKMLEVANIIIALNPDGLARKKVVFKVVSTAKTHNNWDIINEWVHKINPVSLSAQPMKDNSGKERWSDQAVWYNYYIKGLIEKGECKEALKTLDKAIEDFPKQKKFFLRLKAKANYIDGNLDEAGNIYKYLCHIYKSDWWLLHEYAKVIRDFGRKEEALQIMYLAARINVKFETMVSLLIDIGLLCKDLKKYEIARAHFILCKLIRNKKSWSIPESLENNIMELNNIINNEEMSVSFENALEICQKEWDKFVEKINTCHKKLVKNRESRKNLKGRVKILAGDKPYCFIFSGKNESFFSYKSSGYPVHSDQPRR